MSNETTETISNLLKQSGLSGEQAISADSEVLYALYGLQTIPTTIANIAKSANKDVNTFSKLKTDLENKVFNNIPKGAEKIGESPSQNQPQSSVGTSFEQIILNQAKAMRPAMPAGEVPHNLPGAEQSEQEKPGAIHNYIEKSDPYREPLA